VRIADVSVFSRELPVEQVFTRPQLIATPLWIIQSEKLSAITTDMRRGGTQPD
jgi:hypothetical protein